MTGSDAQGRDDSPPVRVEEDVTYAEREAGEMKLDLYVPEIEDPPLCVYIHGGGWVLETRKNTPDLERYAAEWGVAFASVSYRLAEIPEDAEPEFQPEPDNPTPNGQFPAQIIDVKAAIRWLRANAAAYGFDAEAVAVWGASAGGHLAALAGVVDDVESLAGDAYPAETLENDVAPDESGAVQAVACWYPVTDLLELPRRPDSLESILLGGPIPENADKASVASPRTHVAPDSPPHLLIHGRADEVVPVEQSRLLYEALTDHDVDATLYEPHDLGHGFGAESERTAMRELTGDPRPAQSVRATATTGTATSADTLLEALPPAGPDAIERFLARTIG